MTALSPAARGLLRQPLLWALVSALGLLMAGAVGLWHSAAAAAVLARDEARRSAEVGVRLLRAALASPALLQGLPAEQRFTLNLGRLQIPAAVLPLEPPEPEALEAVVPALLRERVAAAEAAEPTAGDGLFDQALALPGLADPLRAWTLVAAAWAAVRRGDLTRARACATAADPCAGPHLHATLTGRVLLGARLRLPPPPALLDAAARLDATAVAALAARCRDFGDAALAQTLTDAAARVQSWRHTLRTAQPLAPLFAAATAPVLHAVAEGLLLYQPAAARDGSGAWLTADALTTRLLTVLGSDAALVAGRITVGAAPAGVAVLSADPLLHVQVLAAAPPTTPRWLLPAGLGAALLLVLLLSLRGLYRESAAVRARAEFLTSVTHELKTPLAGIRVLADLLDNPGTTAARRHEYHGLLAAESERLTALVENVLDLGRMERGERSYDRQDVDGHDVVRQAVARFRPLAERDGLVLEFTADPHPAPVRLDVGAFTQALLNVLDNARKYAASGQRILVRTAAAADQLAVQVRDFGPGLRPDDVERVFQKFARGRDQVAGSVPGVGLGLYLAREILRAHQGDLCHARPERGAGACFVLTVPLQPDADPGGP